MPLAPPANGAVKRLTPPDVGLLDVLNPTAVLSVFGGRGTKLQSALQHVVMVNCRTGEWTAATADSNGDVSLLADGEPGDLVGLLGVGVDGSLGVAGSFTAGLRRTWAYCRLRRRMCMSAHLRT